MDNYVKISKGKIEIIYMKDGEKIKEEVEELYGCIVQRKGIYQIISTRNGFFVEGETDEFDLNNQRFTRYDNTDKTYITDIEGQEDLEIKTGRKVKLNIIVYLRTKKYGILKIFLKESQYIGVEVIGEEIKVLYDNPKKGSLYTIKDGNKVKLTTNIYDILGYTVSMPIGEIIGECDTEIIEYKIKEKGDYKKIKSVEEEFNELFFNI